MFIWVCARQIRGRREGEYLMRNRTVGTVLLVGELKAGRNVCNLPLYNVRSFCHFLSSNIVLLFISSVSTRKK